MNNLSGDWFDVRDGSGNDLVVISKKKKKIDEINQRRMKWIVSFCFLHFN